MTEILAKIVSILIADTTLLKTVSKSSILTGPIDIVQQTQKSLAYPYIVLSIEHEAQLSNPLESRVTHVGIDIWSRNSQLEVQTIYEQVISDLAYLTADQGTAHIFWTRLDSATDHMTGSGTRRIWHRSTTLSVWSRK